MKNERLIAAARKGGRKSKGPRRARTLRVPMDFDAQIEAAAERSGFDDVNGFLLDVLTRAEATGLFEAATPPTRQQRLRLGA